MVSSISSLEVLQQRPISCPDRQVRELEKEWKVENSAA